MKFENCYELDEKTTAYINKIYETAYNALYGMLYDSQLFTVRKVVENGRWVKCAPYPGEGTMAVIEALYNELGLMRDDYKIFSIPEEDDKVLHIVLEIGILELDLQIPPKM